MILTKEEKRKRIHMRLRKTIKGTPERPRLSVFRSNKEIYCQLVDDTVGKTLVAVSSRDAGVTSEGSRIERSKAVGKKLAEKAIAANINTCLFDRAGYLYHGRVKALADGAREGGMKF